MQNISIIGLGKLGSCMAAVYASKGGNIIGVDLNKNFINAINNHQAPVPEPGLDELIKDNAKNLKATHSYNEAVLNSDITFIIVPTPTDETGEFTNKYVVDACKQIASALAKKIDYHLVVLTSTVLPQSCEQEIIPTLEQYSGKKCGRDFHGPINIGSEEMVTINQLAEMVIKISGKNLKIKQVDGPQGVRGRNSDNRLIREKLGWTPSQPLEMGLKKTFEWINE